MFPIFPMFFLWTPVISSFQVGWWLLWTSPPPWASGPSQPRPARHAPPRLAQRPRRTRGRNPAPRCTSCTRKRRRKRSPHPKSPRQLGWIWLENGSFGYPTWSSWYYHDPTKGQISCLGWFSKIWQNVWHVLNWIPDRCIAILGPGSYLLSSGIWPEDVLQWLMFYVSTWVVRGPTRLKRY